MNIKYACAWIVSSSHSVQSLLYAKTAIWTDCAKAHKFVLGSIEGYKVGDSCISCDDL